MWNAGSSLKTSPPLIPVEAIHHSYNILIQYQSRRKA